MESDARMDHSVIEDEAGTILCCGDALIDMLPRALADGAEAFLPATGGAIFNTAIALGRLGIPTSFFAAISNDMFGRRLESDLADAGVDCSLCVRKDRPTTLAFVELTDGNARYTFYDDETAGRTLSIADLPDLPEAVEALHFGGLSLVQEPCGTAYEALLRREAPHRIISLDPNIRADFIRDEMAHRGRIERMMAMTDIIKVSDEDLAWIERGSDAMSAIERWIAGGASIVVVTKGAHGASAYTAGGEVSVPARPAELVDTIGAGDGFDAGLLAGLRQQGVLRKSALPDVSKSQLVRALELAAEIASIIVSRAGADAPWRHELGDSTAFPL